MRVKVDSTREEEFPFGDNVGTLVVCINRQQRKEVQQAFKLPAKYIIPGAIASGMNRYDKIIIFTPHFDDGSDMLQFKGWIETRVLTQRSLMGTVHYV